MRKEFVSSLIQLAEKDERVFLLTADIGYSVLEPFIEKFPKRFLNVGVCEQNMVGVATGLAASGHIPFIYTIVTFATLRPYEFIRNGPILHQSQVRIVGVGGGFDYGPGGPTHYGLEDVGIFRLQPGIQVLVPADSSQAQTILKQTWDKPGPIYYRLGKDSSEIPELSGRFDFGGVQTLRQGKDVLILSMGPVSSEALKAAYHLETKGLSCHVAVVSCLRPAPTESLLWLLRKFKHVVTHEAHFDVGGLGSLVSEVVAENSVRCQVHRFGVKKQFDGETGSSAFMLKKHGLGWKDLVASIQKKGITKTRVS